MCGIVGVFGNKNAAQLAYLGLFALQHRGQESAGIVTSDGEQMKLRVGMGLAADVFDETSLRGLPGRGAVGHVRYATTGASHLKNAQPLSPARAPREPRGDLPVLHGQRGDRPSDRPRQGPDRGRDHPFAPAGGRRLFAALPDAG
ncbi:MAG: hypothetical protein NTX64_02170 [Elusimicrobia bacterium]|nr:hypothetical protein [Elusimicrobiota bacterium]